MTQATYFSNALALFERKNKQESENLLKKFSDDYYKNGTSVLTDAEFDQLTKLFRENFGQDFHTAPQATTADIAHDYPELSGWLGKSADGEALAKWAGDRVRTGASVIGSPKWDGLSVVIKYDAYGNVIRALTRGDDGKGTDVTAIFAGENHFTDHNLQLKSGFGVKYEAVTSWSKLAEMNEKFGSDYKNPRNTVPGILRRGSKDYREFVILVPLRLVFDNQVGQLLDEDAYIDNIDILYPPDESLAFFDPNQGVFDWRQLNQLHCLTLITGETGNPQQEIAEYYDAILSSRETLFKDFMIDGVVFEIITPEDITGMGGVNNVNPIYCTAAKFPSMVGYSVVESIDLDLGTSGRLTPVANYAPISMGGRTFTRTSIANLKRFDELKLCIGTPIIVEVRGDVIAWCDRAGNDPEGATPIELEFPEDTIFTRNKHGERMFAIIAPPVTQQVMRFVEKSGLKGIGIETVNRLVEGNVITSILDLVSLEQRFHAAIQIPGLGVTSVTEVINIINAKIKEGWWDWELLASMNIASIGRTRSKQALSAVTLTELISYAEGSIESEVKAGMEKLLKSKMGTASSTTLLEGVTRQLRLLYDLKQLESHTTKTQTVEIDSSTPKYKVVITGELIHWPDREKFKDYIESLGHKVVGSVTKKTDYLITNDPNSGTVKNRKAEDLGVPIITELQAVEMMNLTLPDAVEAVVMSTSAPGYVNATVEVGLDEL